MPQTYKKAGVDIDAGDHFVDLIAPSAKATYRPEVLSGVGPFAACFEASFKKYKNPILVSSTDGVGTKLKIAIEFGKYGTIGQDLVAMCVNDLICCGAEPLFFLDYFATGVLRPEEHAPIIEGIAKACKVCNCSLIGGETAEMPGMYHGDDFDLAGFAVGVVEREYIIDGGKIKAGDAIIGVASSGLHSNGYSLVRKIIKDAGLDLNSTIVRGEHVEPRNCSSFDKPVLSGVEGLGTNGKTLGEILLTPTKLYPPLVLSLLTGHWPLATGHCIKGIAHITGGGLPGNVPRIIPDTCQAVININSWPRPAIFKFLQEKGNVEEAEMRRVFNLGIGLVLVVDTKSAGNVLKQIERFGEEAWVIGEMKARGGRGEIIFS